MSGVVLTCPRCHWEGEGESCPMCGEVTRIECQRPEEEWIADLRDQARLAARSVCQTCAGTGLVVSDCPDCGVQP